MKLNARSLFVFVALTVGLPFSGHAQEAERLKQFVYVLRVAPNMQDEKTWTEADNRAVGAHFARLQKASKTGQVILAGRTTEPLDKTFGLVIFKAESHEAAERFMMEDPAVVAKLMTATLHPKYCSISFRVWSTSARMSRGWSVGVSYRRTISFFSMTARGGLSEYVLAFA